MQHKKIIVSSALLLVSAHLTAACEESLNHGDNKLLSKNSAFLYYNFGDPNEVKEKIMPDGAVFKTLYYSLGDVSYIIDMKRDLVCGISSGIDDEGYCYPCEYEPGVCP